MEELTNIQMYEDFANRLIDYFDQELPIKTIKKLQNYMQNYITNLKS